VDGVHDSDKMRELKAQGIAHKQQKTEADQHPRIDEIRVISQSLAFTKANMNDAAYISAMVNRSYNKGEVNNPIESFREGDCVDVDTVKMMIEDPNCEVSLLALL